MESAIHVGQSGTLSSKDKPYVQEKSSMPQSQQKDDSNVVRFPAWLITMLVSLMVLFAGSLATNIYWKGQVDEKVHALEERAKEDRQGFRESLDYIRTQNEVNGKDLARIRIYFESQQEKKRKD